MQNLILLNVFKDIYFCHSSYFLSSDLNFFTGYFFSFCSNFLLTISSTSKQSLSSKFWQLTMTSANSSLTCSMSKLSLFHWKHSSNSVDSITMVLAKLLGVWYWSQSRSLVNLLIRLIVSGFTSNQTLIFRRKRRHHRKPFDVLVR